MQEALPISYPARGPGQYCRLWTRPADIRHPSQGGKTNYPGRGVDRKKPLYRPQWLSTAAYKGFGLQLLTTAYNDLQRLYFSIFSTESCALFLASCAHATFHILRMHRSQHFTHSEYTASRVPYTTSHVLRIHRFTHSEYNISRVPYTSLHAFRIQHLTCSVYIISRFPNTTFHSFPIFLYSKMYCVTIPPVLYRGPKITYNTPCSVQEAEISYTVSCSMGEVKYNIRGLLICTGGQIHHVRFYFKR
jgi:hypothetical protein